MEKSTLLGHRKGSGITENLICIVVGTLGGGGGGAVLASVR